jgi:hypothetical protein
MTVKNIYYFRNGGYDARMVASKGAPLESELFGSEGRNMERRETKRQLSH